MNDVTDYVAQVRTALADLPPSARDELLDDLPEHLTEVAAEGEGPLAERLGPPAAYAAELRAAAGAPTVRRRWPTVEIRPRAAVGWLRARLQAIDSGTGPIIGYQRGSEFLRLLRPAWWVARGYLVALTVAELPAHDSIGLLPRVEAGNSTVAGAVLLVAFVIGSIWLGQREVRLPRWYRLGLGVGIVLLVLPGIGNILQVDHDTQRRDWELAPTVVEATPPPMPTPTPSATG